MGNETQIQELNTEIEELKSKLSSVSELVEKLKTGDIEWNNFQLKYPLDTPSQNILDEKTKDIRNYKRVRSTITTATLNISAETDDAWIITALASALTIAAPYGRATNLQPLIIRIKDNGTSRALTFNAVFRAGNLALPTATTISKEMYLGFFYNEEAVKWDLVAYQNGF